jgi:hypothetical protein
MPDNGYGAKTNSADFLLRLYRVAPDFERGDVDVRWFLSLRDRAGASRSGSHARTAS